MAQFKFRLPNTGKLAAPARNSKKKLVRRERQVQCKSGACIRCRLLGIWCDDSIPCMRCAEILWTISSARVLTWTYCARTLAGDLDIFAIGRPPPNVDGTSYQMVAEPPEPAYFFNLDVASFQFASWQIRRRSPFPQPSFPDLEKYVRYLAYCLGDEVFYVPRERECTNDFMRFIRNSELSPVGKSCQRLLNSTCFALLFQHYARTQATASPPNPGGEFLFSILTMKLGSDALAALDRQLSKQRLSQSSPSQRMSLIVAIWHLILLVVQYEPTKTDLRSTQIPEWTFSEYDFGKKATFLLASLAHLLDYVSERSGIRLELRGSLQDIALSTTSPAKHSLFHSPAWTWSGIPASLIESQIYAHFPTDLDFACQSAMTSQCSAIIHVAAATESRPVIFVPGAYQLCWIYPDKTFDYPFHLTKGSTGSCYANPLAAVEDINAYIVSELSALSYLPDGSNLY